MQSNDSSIPEQLNFEQSIDNSNFNSSMKKNEPLRGLLRQKGNVQNLEEDKEIEKLQKNIVDNNDSIQINVNPEELEIIEQNRQYKMAQNQNQTQNFTQSDSDGNEQSVNDIWMKITNIENILQSHSEALSEILSMLRGDTTNNTTNININQRGTTLNNKFVTPDHPNNNHLINDTSIQRVSEEETMDRASSRSDLTQESQHKNINNKIINNDLKINLDVLNYNNNLNHNYNYNNNN